MVLFQLSYNGCGIDNSHNVLVPMKWYALYEVLFQMETDLCTER